jgi:hypothetical protein
LGGVEMGALLAVEQTAQRGQAQRRLAARQRVEGDGQRLPEVAVGVEAAAADGPLAQPGK